MNQKLKMPLAIAIASAVLVGCSSNKVKEAKQAGKEQYVPGKDYPLLKEYNIIGK